MANAPLRREKGAGRDVKDFEDMEEKEDHLSRSGNELGSAKTLVMVKTIFMILAPLVLGIYLELIGSTMQILMLRVDANYEEISQALVARSVGYLFGSLICGILADRFKGHLELLLCVAMVFGGAGTLFSPWCTTLGILAAMFVLQGIGQGMIDTSNNTLCLVLWGAASAAPLHALHFGFGIGAFISPILARPFIHTNETSNSTNNIDSPIEVPYSISAVLCFTFAVTFIGFYIHTRITTRACTSRKESRSTLTFTNRFKSIMSPASCAEGDTTFGLIFFTLVFFFYMSIVGGERAYGKFIYSFSTDSKLGFTTDRAALLTSTFWICFTCGRGISILAAKWVNLKILLSIELFFNIVTCVTLSIWGGDVELVLWIFTGVLGCFLSPVFASGIAFANQYVIMTGTAVALVFVGSSAGGMVYQYLTGYLFENYGPQTLMYVMVGYSISLSFVFALMVIIVRGRVCIDRTGNSGRHRTDVESTSCKMNSEYIE